MSEQHESPEQNNHLVDEKPSSRCLLNIVVVLLTSCICLSTVALSGFGGYQDERSVIKTEDASTKVAYLATQYQLAIEDEGAGVLEIAADRYEYIETEQPGYLDAGVRLNQVRMELSYTPTPSATHTPEPSPTLEATQTPSPTPTDTLPTASPTSSGPSVADMFAKAQTLHDFANWETAIQYLDIVVSLDPTFRRDEVDRMLFNALKTQATIYMYGQNLDDESNGYVGDQLNRGIQMARRALDLHDAKPSVGDVGLLGGDWFFINGYAVARGYVAGGLYGDAVPILQELCALNCGWAYRGVSVQNLLDRATIGN